MLNACASHGNFVADVQQVDDRDRRIHVDRGHAVTFKLRCSPTG